MPISRRDAIRLIAAPLSAAALGDVPLGLTFDARPRHAKLNVLVAGGHPDDTDGPLSRDAARV